MEEPVFFPKPEDFRQWLHAHHSSASELWVGYFKKKTGKPSLTWPESVDEALCYGWIDGIRKSIDEESYKIRFTPRKPRSHWSAVNIKRVAELKKMGRMHHDGLAAFAQRDESRSKKASYEQEQVELDPSFVKTFKKNKKAWDHFCGAAPSYQKTCKWWVMSAKKEETRLKRLQILIDSSEEEQKIPPLRWSK